MSREPTMTVVVVYVKYEAGHYSRESWSETDLYCPTCGCKSVWAEDSPGDYYEGPGHLCVSCRTSFTLPSLTEFHETHKQTAQRLERILAERPHAMNTKDAHDV